MSAPRTDQLRGYAERTSLKRDADTQMMKNINSQIEHAQKQLETAQATKRVLTERLGHEYAVDVYTGALGLNVKALAEEAEKLMQVPPQQQQQPATVVLTDYLRAAIRELVREAVGVRENGGQAQPQPPVEAQPRAPAPSPQAPQAPPPQDAATAAVPPAGDAAAAGAGSAAPGTGAPAIPTVPGAQA